MGDVVPILERRYEFGDSDFAAQSRDNHILEIGTCIKGKFLNNDSGTESDYRYAVDERHLCST